MLNFYEVPERIVIPPGAKENKKEDALIRLEESKKSIYEFIALGNIPQKDGMRIISALSGAKELIQLEAVDGI